MVHASDRSDDLVGIGGPDEGFGIGIGFLQEAVDGGLEIGDAFEDGAFEPTPCQLGEEALDRIEPRGGGWGGVEMKALVPPEPSANPRFREGRLVWALGVKGYCFVSPGRSHELGRCLQLLEVELDNRL